MAQMIALALQQQEQLLRGVLNGLLAQVAQDYNIDHKELVTRYLSQSSCAVIKDGDGIPAPLLVAVQEEKQKKRSQKAKPDKICCKGITAKGQACKFAALQDGFCKKHSEINSKDPNSTKVPKAKVQKPRHTHLTEEEPLETCAVCETLGDVTKPEMPRQDWEIKGADEIQARLKKMLAEASNEVEDSAEDENKVEGSAEGEIKVELSELGILPEEEEEEEEVSEDMESRLRQILAEDPEEEDEEE